MINLFTTNIPSFTSGYNKKIANGIQKAMEKFKPWAFKNMKILDPHRGLKVL